MRASILRHALMGLAMTLAAAPAWAAEPLPTAAESTRDEHEFPIGGSASLTTSLGRGTFNTGVEHQPLLSFEMELRPVWRVDQDLGITIALKLGMWFDAVENAYSESTERQQVFLSDLILSASWSSFAEIESAGLSWDGVFALVMPTSLLSQHVSKVLGLRLGVTTNWEALDWLTVSYDLTGTRNFNLYDSAVLDDGDFSVAPRRRPGGAEAVSDSLTATGEGVTAWALSQSLTLELTIVSGLTALIDFTLGHSWRAKSIPLDEYSSPYAVGGVGRSDWMAGTIELSYELHELVSLTLGTVTEQAPKHADNEGFRFPFWDTTNGALNRQVFYLTAAVSL